jgi:hypothetical protein
MPQRAEDWQLRQAGEIIPRSIPVLDYSAAQVF